MKPMMTGGCSKTSILKISPRTKTEIAELSLDDNFVNFFFISGT